MRHLATLVLGVLTLAGCAALQPGAGTAQFFTTSGLPITADTYASAWAACARAQGLDPNLKIDKTRRYSNAELAAIFHKTAAAVECMDQQGLAVMPAPRR